MQFRAREEPLQILLFEPDPLMSDGAPEEDEHLSVELSAFMSQLIELRGFAEVDAADVVHETLLPSSIDRLADAKPGARQHFLIWFRSVLG